MVKSKCTSNDRTHYITDISNLRIHRAEEVRISICTVCAHKQVLIQLFEFCLTFFFMTEYLHNLLAVHHFFNISVDLTKILLLLKEIFSTLSSSFLCSPDHDRNHNHRHCCQWNIQDQHTDKYTDNCKSTVDNLRNTLAHHLSECINVIRVD